MPCPRTHRGGGAENSWRSGLATGSRRGSRHTAKTNRTQHAYGLGRPNPAGSGGWAGSGVPAGADRVRGPRPTGGPRPGFPPRSRRKAGAAGVPSKRREAGVATWRAGPRRHRIGCRREAGRCAEGPAVRGGATGGRGVPPLSSHTRAFMSIQTPHLTRPAQPFLGVPRSLSGPGR
jgi:hypothetical protein